MVKKKKPNREKQIKEREARKERAEAKRVDPIPEDFNPVFQDKNGKSWDTTLTLGGARRIDEADYSNLTELGFSILSPEKAVFLELMTNSSLVFAMIWTLNQDRAKDNLGIDPAESYDEAELAFLDSLDGPTMERGKRAFWGSLANFFPQHQTALLTLIHQMEKGEKRIGLELQALIPDMEAVMTKEIKAGVREAKEELRKLGGPFGE